MARLFWLCATVAWFLLGLAASASTENEVIGVYNSPSQSAPPKQVPFSLSNSLCQSVLLRLAPFSFPNSPSLSAVPRQAPYFSPKSLFQSASPRNGFRLPVSLSYYPETENPRILEDGCPRDEVRYSNGVCYKLLRRGPCKEFEWIVVDFATHKPICAPRPCNYDRAYLSHDNQCYNFLDETLCPGPQELFLDMYARPICQCPLGYHERDNSRGEDICEPLLGPATICSHDEVFWFKDFNEPPQCIADPCNGDNLERDPEDLPFVPFIDGQCFQLGTMLGVCPAETWFSIAIGKTHGVCSTLEDAGYQFLDASTLDKFLARYGPPIDKDIIGNETIYIPPVPPPSDLLLPAPIWYLSLAPSWYLSPPMEPQPHNRGSSSSSLKNINEVSSGAPPGLVNSLRHGGGATYGIQKGQLVIESTESDGRRLMLHTNDPEMCDLLTKNVFLLVNRDHHRSRRQSSSELIDTRLVQCRSGQKRDVNSKCRPNVTLGMGKTRSRGKRSLTSQ